MVYVSVSDVVDVAKVFDVQEHMSTRISRHILFPPTAACNLFNKMFVPYFVGF